MLVNTKPAPRSAARCTLPLPWALFIALLAALFVLSRSCMQLPHSVSAVTGRDDSELVARVPASASAGRDALKPELQQAKPVDAGDVAKLDDDAVVHAEGEKERRDNAEAEREAVEADAVVREEEEQEAREEDAAAEADAVVKVEEEQEAREEGAAAGGGSDDAGGSDVKPAVKEEGDGEDGRCLEHLFYDKPIKTGSTAITYALREYIQSRGGRHNRCSYEQCTPRAAAVCDGTGEPEHLIGHIKGKDGLVECMKGRGYYTVTSVRKPVERWTSAFLFNRMMKGRHYSIPWNETYSTFMGRFPDCALFHYYDQMGSYCRVGKLPWRERLARIVERYDEVIDLYDADETKGGPLFRKIKKYVKKENVSSKKKGETFGEDFDKSRMEPEQALYDALKAKREGRGDSRRVPC